MSASAKRAAGIKGDLDHFGALGFLQGLLTVLRDSGHPGMLVVLDEIETLQRVRSDVREKGLNALRQLLDEVDLYDDFDPRRHYELTLNGGELTDVERNAWAQRADDANDVELDL